MSCLKESTRLRHKRHLRVSSVHKAPRLSKAGSRYLPQFQHENCEANAVDGEIDQDEGVEENFAVAGRFGLKRSFHPPDWTNTNRQQLLARPR